MLAVILGVGFIFASIATCELMTHIRARINARPFKPKQRLDINIRPTHNSRHFWN